MEREFYQLERKGLASWRLLLYTQSYITNYTETADNFFLVFYFSVCALILSSDFHHRFPLSTKVLILFSLPGRRVYIPSFFFLFILPF